jgi:hypothetical protein
MLGTVQGVDHRVAGGKGQSRLAIEDPGDRCCVRDAHRPAPVRRDRAGNIAGGRVCSILAL